MTRRILVFMLAVLLLGAVPVHAADAVPTFVVDKVSASAGETVDVTVRLENNPGVTSIKLSLEYDDALTLTGVTNNVSLGDQFLRSPEGVYPVILNWYDGMKDVTGDWVFVTLTFAVSEDAPEGTYPVSITYNANDVFNVNEENVTFAIRNGGVSVVDSVPELLNGIHAGGDGSYYYYVDGEIQTSFTGFVANSAANWYVVNGQVQLSYTGLVTVEGERYYIKGGCVNDFTGLKKLEGTWLYFANGQVNTEYVGLVAHNGQLAFVENGEVDFNKKDLVEYEGELYYVKYGLWSPGFTGMMKASDGVWRYVKDGIFDDSYTGLAKNAVSWWYVENGLINTGHSGLVSYGGTDYYIKYGQLMLSTTGVINIKGIRYYIKGGAWQSSYTGTYTDLDGVTWKIVNGIA